MKNKINIITKSFIGTAIIGLGLVIALSISNKNIKNQEIQDLETSNLKLDILETIKQEEERFEIEQTKIDCLAMNIYHESRNQILEGQLAVAHVTMNRVKHKYWPNEVCDVVYQKKQFSWTFLKKDTTPYEKDAWDQAIFIAKDVLYGNTIDPTEGATFFHTPSVKPSWAEQMQMSKKIGNHIFYIWDGKWK